MLPEPKYQAFRHDLLIASFHPGHRAKWTAHELCHVIVGFGYRPGASTYFHAIAAWLAELLPVALWYFFDEAGLTRCPEHLESGVLFQTHCEACERAAHAGARSLNQRDHELVRAGVEYVDRELAAVARSLRLGRPVGHRYASIDLASDGVAYAASHAPRLKAAEMERFVAQFFAEDQGHHASLEALEARVVEVRDAIVRGKKARPLATTRWDFVAQDLGYRLLEARAPLDGERARALDALIDALATDRSTRGVERCIAGYEALATVRRGKTSGLPRAEDVFAVGYALPRGYGVSVTQVAAGIASACPNTWLALGREATSVAASFARADRPERAPIGRRFSRWLAQHAPGPAADLARVEAAISHVSARDPLATQLEPTEAEGTLVRLARGAEIVRVHHDVLSAPPARVKRLGRTEAPRTLLIARADAEQVDVIELPDASARALERAGERGVERAKLGLDEHVVDELLEARLLAPVHYALE